MVVVVDFSRIYPTVLLRGSSAVKGLKFLILSVVFMAAGICSFLLFPPFSPLALSLVLSSAFSAERARESERIGGREKRGDSQSALSDVRLGGPREKNPINQ